MYCLCCVKKKKTLALYVTHSKYTKRVCKGNDVLKFYFGIVDFSLAYIIITSYACA